MAKFCQKNFWVVDKASFFYISPLAEEDFDLGTLAQDKFCLKFLAENGGSNKLWARRFSQNDNNFFRPLGLDENVLVMNFGSGLIV